MVNEPPVVVKQKILYGWTTENKRPVRLAVVAIPSETSTFWNHKGFKTATILIGKKHNILVVPRGIQKGNLGEIKHMFDRLDRIIFTYRKKKGKEVSR